MKPQQIASVIYDSSPQRQRNAYTSEPKHHTTGYNPHNNYQAHTPAAGNSYPHYRPNSSNRMNLFGGRKSKTFNYSGPYDEDFMDSPNGQRGNLLRKDGENGGGDMDALGDVIHEIDIDKDVFERAEVKSLKARDQRLRNTLCIFRFVTRSMNVLFSALIGAFIIEVLDIYRSTKDSKISAGRPGTVPYITAWPQHPDMWPTFLMMAAAISTFFLNSINMIVSCCSCKRPTRRDGGIDAFSCVSTCLYVMIWGIAAGAYQGLKGKRDLYGYSCSRIALARTRHFPDVDFDFSCSGHELILWTSVAAFTFNVLGMAELIFVSKRKKLRKDLGHLEKLKV
ncbi:hypothetical protein ABW19_dt0209207 [Dactylella cylindrospora]|nr:hypothetical protein ABW19_dt0209207 [Dactylella cylindrospora]